MKTCVHFVNIPDHPSQYTAVTFPLVHAYAKRIGATFNIISQRKFPNFPVEYEAMQIHEAGAFYDWNMHIAAGMVLGEWLQDPSLYMSDDCVATNMVFGADQAFRTEGNIYFERNERYVGIAEGFVLSHANTHDVWEPLPGGNFDSYVGLIRDGRRERITSYALSLNMAKYGLKVCGVFPPQSPLSSIKDEELAGRSVVEYISALHKKWRTEF
jgi:hypothetical protein